MYAKLSLFVKLSLVTAAFLTLFGQAALAISSSSWSEAQDYPTSVKEVNLFDRHYRSGAKCLDYTFVLRKAHFGLTIKRGRITVGWYPKREVRVSCATRMRDGYFATVGADNYVKFDGEAVAGKITDHYYRHLIAMEGSADLIVSSDYFKTMYVVEDLRSSLNRAVQMDDTIEYNLRGTDYELDCPNDVACRLDTIGNVMNSLNGKYLAMHIPDFGLVRINLDTGEYQSYGRPSQYIKGSIVPQKRIMSISDDGRYSSVYHTKTKEFYIYDLGNCAPATDASKPDICEYTDLSSQIEPWSIDGTLKHLRFAGDNVSATFSNQGSDKHTQVEIAPPGGKLSPEVDYIALGDSFASGEGDLDDSWYELGTNVPENKCHLSRRSYPYLLGRQLEMDEFHSVACSGAIIEHVSGGKTQYDKTNINLDLGVWIPGHQPQLKYLSQSQKPKLITLSIGGNDVGFADKLTACVTSPGTCRYAREGQDRAYVAMEIASLYDRLIETYRSIIDTTENNSKIYVLGYPQFVKPEGGSCGPNVHLNDDEREFIGQAVTYINQIIRAAAANAGVYYLDVENTFEDRNLCSEIPYRQMAVNGLTIGDDKFLPWIVDKAFLASRPLTDVGLANESYHPNQNGHRLYEDRILELTNGNPVTFEVCENGQKVCPTNERNVPLPNQNYWGREALDFAVKFNENPDQELPEYPRRLTIITETYMDTVNQRYSVRLSDLKPNSEVDFVLNSDPIDLGTFQTDANGNLTASISIPNVVETGVHTLNAYGTNTINEPVHYYQTVVVYDEDNVSNPCLFVEPSGLDSDRDGIDDACDGYYGEIETTASDNASTDTSGTQDDRESSVVATISNNDTPNDDETGGSPFQAVSYLDSTGEQELAVKNNVSGTTLGAVSNGQQNYYDDVGDKASASDNSTVIILWLVAVGSLIAIIALTIRKKFS